MTSLSSLSFHKVESPEDWAIAIGIANETETHDPVTPEEARIWAKSHSHEAVIDRYLLGNPNQFHTYVIVMEAYWTKGKDRFEIKVSPGASVGATERYRQGVEFAMQVARGYGAKKIGAMSSTLHPDRIAVVQDIGFVEVQRNPISSLNPQEFHAQKFPPAKIQFELRTLDELEQMFPSTWEYEAYRLDMDLMRDVPLPEPWEDTPFESFKKSLHNPYLNKTSQFYALIDGIWAATSQIHPNRYNPKNMLTGLTGVRKQFRRNGIATAMKVHALQWAKDHGATRVGTDNEENNPMYQLNVQLGFKKECELILFEREA